MKFLHVLFGLLLLIALAAVSVQVINASLFPGVWGDLLDWMAVRRLWVLSGAMSALLVLVLYVLTGLSRPRQEQFITFDNEGGSVSVSVRAIRDLLGRLGDEFAAVLPELSRLLQEKVKEQVRDVLGFPEVKAVRIHVREIVADAGSPAAKKPAAEPAPEWEETMRI